MPPPVLSGIDTSNLLLPFVADYILKTNEQKAVTVSLISQDLLTMTVLSSTVGSMPLNLGGYDWQKQCYVTVKGRF